MTFCPAGIRNRQTPGGTFRTAFRGDIERMRIVAIVASRIDVGRIILVLQGMKCFLVRGNIIDHQCQPGVGLEGIVSLGLGIQIRMTLHATWRLGDSLMRTSRVFDTLMAGDALQSGMNAFAEDRIRAIRSNS